MTHRPPQDPHPPVADASTASSATTPTPVKISPRVLAENAEPKLVQIGGRARAAAAPTGAKPNASALADDVKAELEGKRGARFWRSLNELADSPGFRAMLQREFPRHAAEMGDGVDRRRFLQLSSASLALAGLTGCAKQPLEKIVPYVSQPEEIIPGKPLYYATTLVQGGFGIGQLAESHMGRPTKVAGNQDHPASLGGSSAQAQASILDLYDPDRVEAVRNLKQIRTWSALTEMLGQRMQALEALEGEGLRILAPTITSPTLTGLLGELSARAPRMRVHPWEPLRSDAAHSGAEAAFGRPLDVVYDFSQADVVLTIGSSVLTQGPGATRYARDYGRRRTVRDVAPEDATMNRHYALETMVTGTGAAADHRLALAPSQLDRFAMIVAAKLGVQGIAMPAGELDEKHAAWLDAAVGDLRAAGARALVVVGEEVSSEVHALAHAINQALGNVGTTVQYVEPLAIEPTNQLASLQALVDDMNAGIVDTLVILGGNPVYTAPVDLAFTEALAKVKVRIYLGTYDDETAEHCHWHVPESHDLESWGDARAYDGTISLMQPLIDPLYRSRTASELVGAMIGKSAVTPEDHVKNHWKAAWGLSGKAFDRAWRKALHDGVVADTAAPTVTPTLQPRGVAIAAERLTARLAEAGSGEGQAGTLELSFLLDPSVLDGRYANNGWLQEVPKPMTKLTWDNALLISPATARALGVYEERFHQGDQQAKSPMMRVTVGERTLDVPVWVLPGHASDSATLHLGYGRARAGRVGTGAGFNANLLRDTGNRWRAQATVARVPTRTTYLLASTQDHHSMEGRDIVRQAALAAYKKKPDYMHPHLHTPTDISLMDGKDFPYDGYAWGMSVDLSACVGCNACVIACQAENNIPVVGKDQVLRGREMHWIRIDRYFQGDEDNLTSILQQPVSCVQCEQAPCEVVCPVAATVHSDEGLNDMIYNRCVGTRYCANNCPYKVRRFNFLLYADFETPSLQLARNPDVTVRSRGVMEKCTYCVQRINTARIDAKREGRKIQDGEIKTACQDACPVEGTIFGDINDPNSAVSKAKESPLDYTLLAELGNRPRTTYLARLRNPNPTLEPESLDPYHGHDGHGHGGGDHGDDHGSDHADDAHASLTPSSSPTSSTAPVTA